VILVSSPRSIRRVLAGVLAVSVLTIFGASPAGAAATASVVDNANGSAIYTYAVTTSSDNVVVLGLPSGTTCTAQTTPANATFFLTSDPQAPGGAMPASPVTIQAGTAAYGPLGGGGYGPVTIAAGTYNICLHNLISQQAATVLQQLQVTLGTVAPTTTTAPAADPVTPTYTG